MDRIYRSVSDAPGGSGAAQTPPLPSVDDLKAQASAAADTARSSLNALASEARDRVNSAVQDRKNAGAEQLSGFAKAAQNAAGDLENQSPAVARIVRDAASSVDRIAGDLRSSDPRDILASVTSFARQQPLAFFAGSVLLGFAAARFLKSEGSASPVSTTTSGATPGSGYRDWSSTHAG